MTITPGKTILVIDDEAAIRESLSSYLVDSGYEVLTAKTGRIGLNMFRSLEPDLILLDLRMPELDGLEVLSQITNGSPQIPIVVISGTGIINDVVEALRLGAWDYLMKPIEDLSVLGHAVSKALERAQLIKENQDYQRHLEKLVEEKTKELKKTNQELASLNQRLKQIAEVERNLSAYTKIEDFGFHLLKEFGRHLLATGGSLYLVEPDGIKLLNVLDPGHAPTFIPFPLKKGSVLQRVLATGKPLFLKNVDFEEDVEPSGWNQYKDGSILCFPLPDEDGVVQGLLSLHSKNPPPFNNQDMEIGNILASYCSEALHTVKATEALRQSEYKYRTLIETSAEGYWLIDLEGKIRDVNQSICAMLGYDRNAMINRDCVDYAPANHRKNLQVEWSGLRDTHFKTYEMVLKHKNGRDIYTQFHQTTLRDEKGKVMGVFAMISDITDRKKTEENLYKAKSLLQAAIEQTPAGILIADAPDVHIQLANSAALAIRGRCDVPLTQISLEHHAHNWQTFHADGTPFNSEELPLSKAVLEGRISKNVQIIIRRQDGGERWVLANAAPVKDHKDQIIAGVLVFADITAIKKIETNLRHTVKEKNVILKEIHHRVKNNFQLINSLINLQKDYLSEKDFLKLLKDIQGRIQSMALVHEALYQSENLASISIKEILTNITQNLHYTYDKISRPVDIHLDCEDIDMILSNAVPFALLVNELISNIYTNAFSGQNHGDIWITFKMPRKNDPFTLIIKDNGMSKPNQFNTSSHSNSNKDLGLRLIAALVKQLEGVIISSVTPEMGTEIRVSFPQKVHSGNNSFFLK